MAPAIVFLHGFTNTGASWQPVVSELGRTLGESYLAAAPDLRGHGSRSGAEPVTLSAVIDDLSRVIRACPRDEGERPPTVVGYSQGGRIALHLALAMPGEIGWLVLIGASPGLADDAKRAERRAADERLADEIEAMSIEAFADRWAKTPVLAGQPPEVLAAAHADRLRNTPAGLARALRGLGTGALPPVWDRLHELESPVTMIVGEDDQKFSSIARQMSPRIIRPRRVEIITVAAGHAVHLERPKEVAALLAKGLRRL